jgi:pentatricopeptide repeat protein
VSALPRNERAINTCTASGPLLDAWTNQGQWTRAPEALQRLRQSGCYPNDTQIQQLFNANPADYQKVKDRIKTQSRYFQLRTLVTIGTQEFALYSLLQRASSATGGKPETRVVTRTLAE